MEKQWENYQILHSKDVILEDSHDWTLNTLSRVGVCLFCLFISRTLLIDMINY